jgi:RHS repeat-associated protein
MVEHGLGAASTATTTYTVGAGNAGPRQLTSLSTTVDAATTKSSFTYDASGNRLVRADASGTTVYLPGGQEILINGSEVSATRYYSFAGRTVAVRSGTGMAGVSSLVCDSHGSVVASVPNTVWTATSVKRVFSDPFGAIRGGSDAGVPGDHRFLGAVRDTGSGLTLLGARYYDERVGQFISVDPLLDSGSPAQFNACVYSGNNPVTWSDPSGMVWQGANWKSDAPATPTNSGVTSSSGGSSSATPPPSTSFAAYFECKDIWCQISWDANFNLQIVGGVAKGAWDLVCFSTGIPGLVDSFTELGEAVSDFDGYQAKKAAERDALWSVVSGGPDAWWHAATDPIVDAWNTNPGELIGEGAVTVATFAVPGGALIKAGKGVEEVGALAKAGSKLKVNWGQQEKHFPGHNNFQFGSELTANPEKLMEQAGSGAQLGKAQLGEPGYRERVDFGENIGTHVDPTSGVRSPTSKGIIHYKMDGTGHIVPARPE